MENVGAKIQSITRIINIAILALGSFGIFIALFISINRWEQIATNIMIGSISSIVLSLIAYYPMIGFGQLIINSEIIAQKLSESEKDGAN